MLKNDTKKNIYDNLGLIFRHDKLHNDNFIPKIFTKQLFRIKLRPKMKISSVM